MRESAQIVLHPFFLTFSDGNLESHYVRIQTQNFSNTDRCFCFWNLVLLLPFAYIQWTFQCELTGIMIPIISFASFLIQLVLMNIRNQEHWIQHRLSYICFFRSTRILMSLIAIPYWLDAPGYRPSAFKALFIMSGSLYNVWHGFGSPVIFRYHVPMQVSLSILSLFLIGLPQCKNLIELPQILESIQHIKQSVRFQKERSL